MHIWCKMEFNFCIYLRMWVIERTFERVVRQNVYKSVDKSLISLRRIILEPVQHTCGYSLRCAFACIKLCFRIVFQSVRIDECITLFYLPFCVWHHSVDNLIRIWLLCGQLPAHHAKYENAYYDYLFSHNTNCLNSRLQYLQR
ncbi:hypothetical protein SDC9_119581 [bioreactor metagenome]|uniref:Uncharacterized protein n=1 Tax=bioreactor metagenome TaxID=1076179 RepID=A0A645C4X0_9ZZZZ